MFLPHLTTDNPAVGGRDPNLAISKVGHAHHMVANLEHTATFSALGYNEASKQQRKFLAAPYEASYSAILDTSIHLYLYR